MTVIMIVVMVMVVSVAVMMMVVMVVVVIGVRPNAFDVVVMAFLWKPDLIFEPQYLFPVLAHLAVHIAGTFLDFDHPVDERLEDERLCIQIWRLYEFDLGMPCSDGVGVVVNAPDQNAGKQKIWEHDDPTEAQFGRMLEAWLDQREGYAGVAHFTPAEAKGFPEQPHDLRDIRIGIWIGSAAANDHEQGFVFRHIIRCAVEGFLNALACGTHHLHVDAQFTTILDGDTRVLSHVRVEDRRNIVLYVASGEKHARKREDVGVTLFLQGIEAGPYDGRGELQEAMINVVIG